MKPERRVYDHLQGESAVKIRRAARKSMVWGLVIVLAGPVIGFGIWMVWRPKFTYSYPATVDLEAIRQSQQDAQAQAAAEYREKERELEWRLESQKHREREIQVKKTAMCVGAGIIAVGFLKIAIAKISTWIHHE